MSHDVAPSVAGSRPTGEAAENPTGQTTQSSPAGADARPETTHPEAPAAAGNGASAAPIVTAARPGGNVGTAVKVNHEGEAPAATTGAKGPATAAATGAKGPAPESGANGAAATGANGAAPAKSVAPDRLVPGSGSIAHRGSDAATTADSAPEDAGRAAQRVSHPADGRETAPPAAATSAPTTDQAAEDRPTTDPVAEDTVEWPANGRSPYEVDDENDGVVVPLRERANTTRDPAGETGSGFGLAGTPTGRRVRARLARFNAPWQAPQVSEVLEPLIATHRASHPKADARLLQRAFDMAARWHSGQYRKSGDPYITHPLAVATILANLGMDTTTLVAALLHDTIEDTDYTLESMRTDFGGEVALLVDGVTKLDKVKLGDAAKAETIRKMVVAMAKDPRVLVIKLADRLHNMRTLTFLPRPKQEQKAKETLEILAPLAHRLGMNTIKWELEDLAFGTLFPKRFEEINRLIGEHQPQREALLRQVTQKVHTDLRSAKIKAETTGRPKHLYSIYQKMIVRGRDFNDIYDLVGVRILVETVRDCYAALGVIHANWQPVPGRFKDYIAMPKFNMYQSLHTTVIGPTGKPVEMQIRTYAMHRTAEFGIAAHWKYKEQKGATIVGPPAHIDEMTWLRQLLDWQREASDPSEFLDALRFDLSSQEVYVFTPKGDVIPLPTGSTPVDFAYAVHTEVGHKCIGARVNGKLVPLESTLSNGDVIEIFTSKSDTAGPTQDWLGFVKSPRARTKIRQYFNKERREEAIEAGKDAIVKAMRKQGVPLQRMLTTDNLMTIARDLHLADVASLYAAVGDNQVSAQSVVQRLMAGYGGEEGAAEDLAETAVATRPPRSRTAGHDPGVVVKGVSDVWIKLARCCTPVPPDSVFGFVTRSGGVSVHRDDCANAEDLKAQPERVLEVSWKLTSASTFLVAIQVEALDRHKLLADVTRVLSEERVNILSATVTTTRDRVAVSRFSFEMADPKHLGHLLAAVRKVDGVFDAYRVTSGA
ncbi:GTP pyrophosphokinase [Asanoa ishikariensis]|uniref:GTP pyrophosphokinase n=1 Tax=Asanoa ishikariensis TaxID=137265 RepID=A0A1H3SAY2_9ACTN|nr:bifunctional (p)ppGpp synthetase/guanosine-3',5'-bis(diphosphate) 3'-pyrophosphohydrolase [Asanoa ishikariensis]GIF70222.1 GTP pyrophosphokinase [Asanoa ishikariensis]SDZ35104.1 GTP pyrophosphokinase [Asanoa ishikariensis]